MLLLAHLGEPPPRQSYHKPTIHVDTYVDSLGFLQLCILFDEILVCCLIGVEIGRGKLGGPATLESHDVS